ncbi:hypothetical protein [Methyloterricola oryzae]|uniref:hypothetical protein n=1 Tax=Methyloterricola oryzae TaxID=1495050 RepID=UPI0009E5C037|nr:hypothetical protein [Methyloterricola oryzae]
MKNFIKKIIGKLGYKLVKLTKDRKISIDSFVTANRRPKIYDCFIFNDELSLLKIRLAYLYNHVEKFVLCESTRNFSGKSKPLQFAENAADFEVWMDKIIHIKYDPDISGFNFDRPNQYDSSHPAWLLEAGQRNKLQSEVSQLDDDCLVVLTDVDEIWNADTIDKIYAAMCSRNIPIARLEMDFFYYFMNCIGVGSGNSNWILPVCMTGNAASNKNLGSFNSRRQNSSEYKIFPSAGWHFSYLGGPEAVIRKIESFSHQEYNISTYTERTRIENCIKMGIDLFDRAGHKWAFCSLDRFPSDLSSLFLERPEFCRTDLSPVKKGDA